MILVAVIISLIVLDIGWECWVAHQLTKNREKMRIEEEMHDAERRREEIEIEEKIKEEKKSM